MNFFKSSKYKLTSPKNKQEKKSEHFHKLESSTPKDNEKAKKKAPEAPAQANQSPASHTSTSNQVVACFTIRNKTSLPLKRFIGDSVFPDEISSQEDKMVRIGTEIAQPMACYIIDKGGDRFEFKIEVSNKMGQWFVGASWKEPDRVSEFYFNPDLTGPDHHQLPAPETETFVLEVHHKQEQGF